VEVQIDRGQTVRPKTKWQLIWDQISPAALQRALKQSQHDINKQLEDIDKQLSDMIAQLGCQTDSTFGNGKTWAESSWPEFADCLVAHGKSLTELGERLQHERMNETNQTCHD
jgi:uncharacterized protein YukE